MCVCMCMYNIELASGGEKKGYLVEGSMLPLVGSLLLSR